MYTFPRPAPGDSPDTHAQRLVDLMFNRVDPEPEVRIERVLLSALSLMPHKRGKKSPVNHRAELFIWIGAHDADYPRHQPLWLNAENQVTEGSSTYLSLLENFPPAHYPNLTIPCVRREFEAAERVNAVLAQDRERELVHATWRGDVDWVRNVLARGARGATMVPEFGTTALEKARQLGYTDIVDAITDTAVGAPQSSSSAAATAAVA